MPGLWTISDLHVDSAPLKLATVPPGADIMVIAGDVAEGWDRSIQWLAKTAVPLGLPVVFVPGNHELYGGDFNEDRSADFAKAGIRFVHPGRPVTIEGVRFVGGTLWTDYAINGDATAAISWARREMPDIRGIDVGMRRLRPTDLVEAHRSQRAAIETDLAIPFAGPTVVVTHHAPHARSLRNDSDTVSSGSFASDLTLTIEEFRPALWIHGHIHQSCDYTVSSTRVICNPRGYAAIRSDGRPSGNPAFLEGLVLRV